MRGGSNRRQGLGRSILLGAGVVVFLVFAAVLWFAYVDVVGIGISGPPPLIRADASPIKRAPDDPGGMAVANSDSAVARILEEQVEPIRRERILPAQDQATPAPPAAAPELADAGNPTDLTPAAAATAAADVQPSQRPLESPHELPPPLEAPEPSATPVLVAATASDAMVEPLLARDPGPDALDPGVTPEGQAVVPMPAPPRRAETVVAALETPVRTRSLAPPARTASPAAGPAPVQTAARQPADEPTIRSAPAASPTFRVQLGAFRSDNAANQAWIDIQRRNRPTLGVLRASVLAAETSSGTFYRLQAGPLPSRDAAAQTCVDVKQGGSDCFVVGPLP